MKHKSLTVKKIAETIEKLKQQSKDSPAKLKFIEQNERLFSSEKNYQKKKKFFEFMQNELERWSERPENPLSNEALSDECKKFAEIVVAKLGETVGSLKEEAAKLGLDENQTRRVLLTAFRLVGDRAGLAYNSFVQTLRHNL